MKQKKGKKKIITRIIIIAIIVILLALCILPRLFAKTPLPTVDVVQAVTGDVEEVLDTSGMVGSENTKTYFSPVNAKISTCDIKVGSVVKKGDKLLQYDLEDLQTQYEKATLQTKSTNYDTQLQIEASNKSSAAASEASNEITSLEAQITAKEAEIESLKSQIAAESNGESASSKIAKLNKEAATISKNKIEAQSQIDAYLKKEEAGTITDKEKEKLTKLQENMVTWEKREVDINAELATLTSNTTDTSTSSLQTQLEEAAAELQTLENDLATQESTKKTSESAVITGSQKAKIAVQEELAKYDQMSAEELLEQAKGGITADFDGVVSAVTAVKGSTATQGGELFTVVQSDSIKVDISLSKYDLEKVKENQTATVTIAGKEYDGTLTRINRIAETNEKGATLVKAEVHVNNPDDSIYIGIEAKVKVNIDSAKDVVIVPVQAVNSGKDGDFCYVVEDDVVVKKMVTTGVSSTEFIEIKEGIEQGDMVVTDSGDGIEEGSKVTPLEQENEAMKEEQTQDSKDK